MNSKESLDNAVLLITGGTGSFGNATLERFVSSQVSEIRILSRDEKKQDDMRRQYSSDRVKFFIGDVRDERSLQPVMNGVDYVFHAAALKQVPSCEFYPMEALKTNVIGTENVLRTAINAGVKKVVCLSTDKAVYPINAMGMSKALMEKVVVATSRTLSDHQTVICGTRYGNVMGSRGSVIPLFISQIREGRKLTVTDPDMTRFMMNLDEAIDLVLYAFLNGENGDIFVQKSPAATIAVLADVLREMFANDQYPIDVVGTRHGEKLYEVLLSKEEMRIAEDRGDYFRIPSDPRDLNYSTYVEVGDKKLSEVEEYNSHNTDRLDADQLRERLLGLPLVQQALNES